MRKLIRDVEGHSEYYDLRHDPGEKSPIRSFDGIPSSLQYALEQFVILVGPHAAADQTSGIYQKTRDRLRALGYAR